MGMETGHRMGNVPFGSAGDVSFELKMIFTSLVIMI